MNAVTMLALHMQHTTKVMWCNPNRCTAPMERAGSQRVHWAAVESTYYTILWYNSVRIFIALLPLDASASVMWTHLVLFLSLPTSTLVHLFSCNKCIWDEPGESTLTSQILYLLSLFLVYGRWSRLAGAWHPTGSGWSSTWVEEGGALQCREDPQTPSSNSGPCHTRSLLLRHLLQLCSQLLGVNTWGTLPSWWDKCM